MKVLPTEADSRTFEIGPIHCCFGVLLGISIEFIEYMGHTQLTHSTTTIFDDTAKRKATAQRKARLKQKAAEAKAEALEDKMLKATEGAEEIVEVVPTGEATANFEDFLSHFGKGQTQRPANMPSRRPKDGKYTSTGGAERE